MPLEKENAFCDKCHNIRPIKKLYKLTWRYNDKERKYQKTKRFIIHTGYNYLCKKCLNETIK